jgi:hypothetical protein
MNTRHQAPSSPLKQPNPHAQYSSFDGQYTSLGNQYSELDGQYSSEGQYSTEYLDSSQSARFQAPASNTSHTSNHFSSGGNQYGDQYGENGGYSDPSAPNSHQFSHANHSNHSQHQESTNPHLDSTVSFAGSDSFGAEFSAHSEEGDASGNSSQYPPLNKKLPAELEEKFEEVMLNFPTGFEIGRFPLHYHQVRLLNIMK